MKTVARETIFGILLITSTVAQAQLLLLHGEQSICESVVECTALRDQVIARRNEFLIPNMPTFVPQSWATEQRDEVKKNCEGMGMRLPTVHEAIQFAMSRGARGVVDRCQRSDDTCKHITTLKPDGSVEQFKYKFSGYRRLQRPYSGDIGSESTFWTSSNLVNEEGHNLGIYVFDGISGSMLDRSVQYGVKRSGLCVSDSPRAVIRTAAPPVCGSLEECQSLYDEVDAKRQQFIVLSRPSLSNTLLVFKPTVGDAEAICTNYYRGRLPSARDFAFYAMTQGARGIVAQCENGDQTCSEIKTSEYHGGEDNFYFSFDGYLNSNNPNSIWTSSKLKSELSNEDAHYEFNAYRGEIKLFSTPPVGVAIQCKSRSR